MEGIMDTNNDKNETKQTGQTTTPIEQTVVESQTQQSSSVTEESQSSNPTNGVNDAELASKTEQKSSSESVTQSKTQQGLDKPDSKEPPAANQFQQIGEALGGTMQTADKLQAIVTLSDATASTKLGHDAIESMSNLDLAKIISAPLDAAVNAQYKAAKTTLKCIDEIGVKNGTLSVVVFNFIKNGMQAKMSIPLLSLVPINTVRINEMTYNFKLAIKTSSSLNIISGIDTSFGANFGNSTKQAQPKADEKKKSSEAPASGGADKEATADAIKSKVSVEPTFGVNFSTKKDSKATQDSKYSVESSMDVSLKVGPDDMPGGISKMLEILNESIDIFNPNGELTVSETSAKLVNGVATVIVKYRDGNGISAPQKVTCKHASDSSAKVTCLNNGDCRQLVFSKEGLYIITADKNQIAVNIE